jgi:hypothetical protein
MYARSRDPIESRVPNKADCDDRVQVKFGEETAKKLD